MMKKYPSSRRVAAHWRLLLLWLCSLNGSSHACNGNRAVDQQWTSTIAWEGICDTGVSVYNLDTCTYRAIPERLESCFVDENCMSFESVLDDFDLTLAERTAILDCARQVPYLHRSTTTSLYTLEDTLSQLELRYFTSHNDVHVTLLEHDCQDELTLGAPQATLHDRQDTPFRNELTLKLDLHSDHLQDASIWYPVQHRQDGEQPQTGQIRFCLRLDLPELYTSYTQVALTTTLLHKQDTPTFQDIQLLSLTDVPEPTLSDRSTSSLVQVCPCDQDHVCLDTQTLKSRHLRLCLLPRDSQHVVTQLESLFFLPSITTVLADSMPQLPDTQIHWMDAPHLAAVVETRIPDHYSSQLKLVGVAQVAVASSELEWHQVDTTTVSSTFALQLTLDLPQKLLNLNWPVVVMIVSYGILMAIVLCFMVRWYQNRNTKANTTISSDCKPKELVEDETEIDDDDDDDDTFVL